MVRKPDLRAPVSKIKPNMETSCSSFQYGQFQKFKQSFPLKQENC
jgi:hypothetical protein